MPTPTSLLFTMLSCATLLVHETCHGQSKEQPSLRTYRLAATPTFNIGDGRDPQHEFLRIDGAWRMPSGEIAVVNAGSSEIRVFGVLGVFSKSFGRAGDGPGEFRSIGWSSHRGDTVFI